MEEVKSLDQLRQELQFYQQQHQNCQAQSGQLKQQKENNDLKLNNLRQRQTDVQQNIANYRALQTDRQQNLQQKQQAAMPKRLALNDPNGTYSRWNQLIAQKSEQEITLSSLTRNFQYMEQLANNPGQNIIKPEEAVTKYYDLIIDIDSLLGALEGWNIYFHEIYKDSKKSAEFINYLSVPKCLVGFIGMSNKGKSHILGKINDQIVPAGFDVHTRGLSFTKGNQKIGLNCDFLDSQGLGVALQFKQDREVSKIINERKKWNTERDQIEDLLNKKNYGKFQSEKQNEKFKEELADKLNILSQDKTVSKKIKIIKINQLTESFLQSFMMEKCNILLIVVGIQTTYEQQLILRLARIHKDKTLIIIHNFSTLFTKEQVNEQIHKDILNCYDVQLRSANCRTRTSVLYIDKTYQTDIDSQNNQPNPAIHLIYCRENTEPGNVYNQGTIEYIQAIINQRTINPDKYMTISTALEQYFAEQFQQQFSQDFQIRFNFDSVNMKFALQQDQNFNKTIFLEKLQNAHKMPLQNQDNEQFSIIPEPKEINENNNQYFTATLKIDLAMIPNLFDQLNNIVKNNELIKREQETKVYIMQYGNEFGSFYFLEILLHRPKLQEMLRVEFDQNGNKKSGFKELHPISFKPIKMNKKIYNAHQITLGQDMPFKYDNGVLSLYLHCQNYETLLEGDLVQQIQEEIGLDIIDIGDQNNQE